MQMLDFNLFLLLYQLQLLCLVLVQQVDFITLYMQVIQQFPHNVTFLEHQDHANSWFSSSFPLSSS